MFMSHRACFIWSVSTIKFVELISIYYYYDYYMTNDKTAYKVHQSNPFYDSS